MDNILEYKGYMSKIGYSADDKLLFGKIEGIVDLVTFQAESSLEIENEFHAAVDDYLAFCEGQGVSPDKAFSGTFNVRITPELHRSLHLHAYKNSATMNSTVELAIEQFLNGDGGDKNHMEAYFAAMQALRAERTMTITQGRVNPVFPWSPVRTGEQHGYKQ